MTHWQATCRIGAYAVALLSGTSAYAQAAPTPQEIRAEIEQLRVDTDRQIADLRAQTDARIARLAAALDASDPQGAAAYAEASPASEPAAQAPTPGPKADPRLALSGDLRVRYESNFGADRRDRGRTAVRARLAATYRFDDHFSAGGRIVTGNPDDPNTADVTLAGFDDDLLVNLDQAYGKAKFGNVVLTAGKFANPFVRTDLVWDGDVNPQGIAGTIGSNLGDLDVQLNALHFVINEDSGARDSVMNGAQVVFGAALSPTVSAQIAAGYYDYSLHSLAGGDAGDFRTNLMAGGDYLSDFRLLDAIGTLTFTGLGERLPVRLVGDYVHNFGAAVPDDNGYSVDIYLGRASQPNDWRIQYGYADMGVDAVFAAFSHDNTDLATNYLQHTAAFDYVVARDVVLNATFYRYRLRNPAYAGALVPGDWANRLRLAVIYGF